ncbi:MAG: insulinase family protein [Treponema sp.]|nr:insulinase family protein [Treponema sp.]
MKKFIFGVLVLVSLGFLWAEPAKNVRQYTLENGLTVYLLEDSSTPLIRFEYSVRAGFSSQTKTTSGFYKLYANILQASLPDINFDSVQCNADSTRFITTISPSRLKTTAAQLSNAVFNLEIPDDLLETELNKLKKQVKENAAELSSYINSAIDSRVFSEAPWKHDSGVYPAIFNKTTTQQARTKLKVISDHWYIPQNSALFISGNVNKEQLLKLLEQTFGCYYSTYLIPVEKPALPVNKDRKFVLHSSEFSEELTQVVIQYTTMDVETTDLAAAILNNDYSSFKNELLSLEKLNIPGAEYINAASAHKKDSSRLIIQTLLQKTSGTSVFDQVQDFYNISKAAGNSISAPEYYYGKEQLFSNLNYINTSSDIFMDNLASFWALEPYETFTETALNDSEMSVTAANLMTRSEKINSVSMDQLYEGLRSEEPFVFVLMNMKDYTENKKALVAAGYKEVTVKSAPWYGQPAFFETAESKASETTAGIINIPSATDNNYYQNSIASIQKLSLTNGIPVTAKYNGNTSGITLLISIAGGKLNTAQNHGMEEVMINLIASNIQKEIFLQQQQQLIFGSPEVTNSTGLTSSYISIDCDKEDFASVCKAVSNSLIYSDIQPASADRAVSNRQYKKRLENGSAVSQMFSSLVETLLPASDYSQIFEAKKDILEKTSYNDILAEYPAFLDAGRYNIIVTGNFDSNLRETLNYSLGLLSSQNQRIVFAPAEINLPKNKNQTVKITHTFLTDIPAEKAGPMPAVLIPTTEFLDPVMYVIKAPEITNKRDRVIWESEMLYLGNLIQTEINKNSRLKNCTVSVLLPYAQMDFGTLIIQNGAHTKEVDGCVRNGIQNLQKLLKSGTADSMLQKMKDNWLFSQLSETSSNKGTAKLLQQGIEYFPVVLNILQYFLQPLNHCIFLLLFLCQILWKEWS